MQATKKPHKAGFLLTVAERTGLEPATSGVTGQHSNQLNYRSTLYNQRCEPTWRPHGDSNPGRHRERVVS